MKIPKKQTLVAKILKKLGPRIGAKITTEPVWGVVGKIDFRNGKRRYFRYSSLDLNTQGASEIARDKDYSKYFMKFLGYPTIPGKAFCSESWAQEIGSNESTEAALKYARGIGWPVIVKPNSQGQGYGVVKVWNSKEFLTAFKKAELLDRMILVEEFTTGRDYRIVVLDEKIISAYERIPLSVIGDGKSSIIRLLRNKQDTFKKSDRDTVIKFNDPRMKSKLRRQKLSFSSVVEKGRQVFLLDNANLSTGGDAFDVTNSIHNDFKKMSIKLARDMNLRLTGIDLLVDGDIVKPIDEARKVSVIEINCSPGLDHYAAKGPRQKKTVEKMYLKILKAIEKT